MKTIDRRKLLALGAALGGTATLLPLTGGRARAQTAAPDGAAPLALYAAQPLVEHIALSPDGSRVAFITHAGDQKVLCFFTVAERRIYRLNMGPMKARGLLWGDNSHIVVVDSRVMNLQHFAQRRDEFTQAQIIDVTATRITGVLFDRMDDFYSIVIGQPRRIKAGNEYRIIAANYRMPGLQLGQVDVAGDFNLCLYSFGLTGQSLPHEIYEGTPHTRDFVTTADGAPLAYADFKDDSASGEKEWTLYYNLGTAASPKFKPVYTVRNAADYPDLQGLGRDGKSVVVSVKNPDIGGYDYHEISADGTMGPVLDPQGADQAHFPLYHPTSGALAGFGRRGDWLSYAYDDPSLKTLAETLPQVLGEDYRFEIVEMAEDPRKMLIYVEAADDAGSYVFIDFGSGATAVLESNYPDLPASGISQKKAVSYKAGDGLDIHAYLTLPPGKPAKDLPLIVMPHGGPQARDDIGFDRDAQAFASRGYAVLQPNFRGSSGYGAGFVQAGYGEWGGKMQTDLSDGVKWLAAQGIADPKRVAIYGASYGGYAALAGATIDPAGTYRCAVDIAGVSDIPSLLDMLALHTNGDRSYEVEYEKRWFGPPSRYAAISPASQAARAYCPILIIHGTDDTVVPVAQSQRMVNALKAAGKDVQFITYPGQDHWETLGASKVAMMQAVMDFLGQHNPA
jgi:dipeptidyl aminopeptidase/acylaminoacyl peptidase